MPRIEWERQLKCPYNDFADCLGVNCPACEYTTTQKKTYSGRKYSWMSMDTALKEGYMWEEMETVHTVTGCSFAKSGMQVPDKTEINNNVKSSSHSSYVKHSIF